MLCLDRPTVSKIENFKRALKLAEFLRLVDALSLTAPEALALGRELAGLPAAPPALAWSPPPELGLRVLLRDADGYAIPVTVRGLSWTMTQDGPAVQVTVDTGRRILVAIDPNELGLLTEPTPIHTTPAPTNVSMPSVTGLKGAA